jgi:dipeptidyl aminopeptidase/acylaminoacyl peptidase
MSNSPRSLQKEDLFRFQWLQGGQLSPNGKQAIYALSHIEGEVGKEEEFSTLYLIDTATGQSRKMTSGKQKDTHPAWSPDGKSIAFLSNRKDKPQIYLLPVDGGEAQALISLKQGAGAPIWSPNGQWIAFTAGIDYGDKPAPDRAKDPYRVTRNVWRFDAIGDLDLAVNNVYVLNLESKEIKQLTDDASLIADVSWHPSSDSLLVGKMMHPTSWNNVRYSYDLIGLDDNQQAIQHGWGDIYNPLWLPDGKHIVFTGNPDTGAPIGTHNNLWVLNSETGEISNRSQGMELTILGGLEGRSPTLSQWKPTLGLSTDRKHIYAQVQEGGEVGIYRFALEGAVAYEKVFSGERACILLDMEADSLLYSVSSIQNPHQLYLGKTDGSEQCLTDPNAELMEEFIPLESVHLNFKGTDGANVEGWFVKPTNGASAPYPTILWIHGGPHGAQGNTFTFDNNMFAGAGYGVLFINHRASTGYGDAFATAIKGDWGNLDYGDLMAGVDDAIAKGLADPDKLGVCGISGGGNLSCWIVGQTNRFKAAVPQNPVTNWQSFYGVSDVGVWFAVEELGGHPHEIPEIYVKCSPISYAHRCKTPTLLIQTEHDWRCPAEQSEQFYTVLRANGCTVEMLRQPAASHGGSIRGALPLRQMNLSATLDWFNQYIMS